MSLLQPGSTTWQMAPSDFSRMFFHRNQLWPNIVAQKNKQLLEDLTLLATFTHKIPDPDCIYLQEANPWHTFLKAMLVHIGNKGLKAGQPTLLES